MERPEAGALEPAWLAAVERSLREMATRRAWGQVIVHFRDGAPYEIRVVETRVLKGPGRHQAPSSEGRIEPAA
ncbi:MAG TPA: hypothetical protein P5144_15425 [Thermoanaerobaculia bacterium]|mgnify:FL=1|nr:hypothetical protein [Thermoanaerobaculia bacterium]HRU10766.1 hypothetical protein [Thermoanaerobaculia bacterium]